MTELAAGTGSLGPDSPAFAIYPSRLAALFDAATDYARDKGLAWPPDLRGERRAQRPNPSRFLLRFQGDGGRHAAGRGVRAAARGVPGFCPCHDRCAARPRRPALYVSGYLRTIPPAGKPRLAGADASHAWVSVWCGPAFGWFGLDPTNAIPEGDDHVVVARGRDYADVPPVDGVVLCVGRTRPRIRGGRNSDIGAAMRSHEPGPDEIEAAHARISGHVRRTPLLETASPVAGAPRISLKLEFLPRAGSFKPRGAFNNLLTRAAPAIGCAATASGGNPGAAVAYAAGRLGIRARVFVPEIASPVKIAKIKAFGADVHVEGATYYEALALCDAYVAADQGALAVHAYEFRCDDRRPGNRGPGMGSRSGAARRAAARHRAGRGRRRRIDRGNRGVVRPTRQGGRRRARGLAGPPCCV